MKIYLIGLMGSGKTTIGKKLARQLSYDFFDIDDLIEQRTGKSISAFFEENGEEAFRFTEQSVLRETFTLENTVLSTGGGTPCFFSNIAEINLHGISCYLRADAGLLANRLQDGVEERPLLKHLDTQAGLVSYLTQLIEKREPFYAKAKIIVEAKDLTVAGLMDALNSILLNG